MTYTLDGQEMPVGFSMALAQNTRAMNAFCALPPAQRQALIESARKADSKRDMQRFVDSLD